MNNGYFQWDKDFLTGVETVDSQHYGLVEMINELLKLSFLNEKIEHDVILDLENKLMHYVAIHFNTEYDLMKQYAIDERHVSKHLMLHADFIKTVTGYFEDKVELTDPNKLSEIIEYLVRWLAYHILNTDKSMARQIKYISEEGLSPEAAYDQDEKTTDATAEPLLKALRALFFLISQKNKELEEKVAQRTLELQNANRLLEYQSIIDELTELPNRRFVMNELDRLKYSFERYDVDFSILFIDLNKFKVVNDTYGHECGDTVLKWTAKFLKENTRQSDTPCRLGGDEFVVLCPHSDGEQAFALAKKFIELIQNMATDEKLAFWEPSFSIGIAQYDASINETSDILSKADAAMYESKKHGGNFAVLAE